MTTQEIADRITVGYRGRLVTLTNRVGPLVVMVKDGERHAFVEFHELGMTRQEVINRLSFVKENKTYIFTRLLFPDKVVLQDRLSGKQENESDDAMESYDVSLFYAKDLSPVGV